MNYPRIAATISSLPKDGIQPIEPLSPEREGGKPATLEEILSSLTGRSGTVTLNGMDFGVLRGTERGRFNPITTRDLLMTGWMGTFDKVLHIYISRKIPVGYYYLGYIQELHTQFVAGIGVQPDLDPQTIAQVQRGLEPFKLAQS